MKTVVITGSSKGFGFEMAKQFRTHNCNVVISGRNAKRAKKGRRIAWLTNGKSFIRFLTAPFHKRNFFTEN